MPLISSRNPEVLDIANVEENENNSMLRRHSPVTIPNATAEDAVSVMTLHSAFQTTGVEQNGSSPKNYTRKKPALSSFMEKITHSNERCRSNVSQDEFSLDSLPIQNSDIESVEQMWIEEQRKADDVLERCKRYSTQTYSDKGTVHSSLHRYSTDRDETRSRSTASRSAAINFSNTSDRSYVQNSSKAHGTARILPTTRTSTVSLGTASKQDISMTEKKHPKKNPKRETMTSRIPSGSKSKKSKRRRSKNSLMEETESTAKSTKEETMSVGSNASNTSSKKTTDSTLHKEMFRLSLELANTLAALDVSNSEVARYRVMVQNLQNRVEDLEAEKTVFKAKLEGYQRAEAFEAEGNTLTQNRSEGRPVCVTPTRLSERLSRNNNRRVYLSPDPTHNSSFSDPPQSSREMSGILFPELNESHISCPDLYSSRMHDDLGATIEEVDEVEQTNVDDSNPFVDIIDPRDEIFNDDPFATFNYSDDESAVTSGSSSGDNVGEDENTIFTKASEAAVVSQTLNRTRKELNTTTMTQNSVLSNITKNLPIFQRNAKESFSNSIESKMKKMANLAPSKRDSSFLNQTSRSALNISSIFKFGNKGDTDQDALSVSVRSQYSLSIKRQNFLNFGK